MITLITIVFNASLLIILVSSIPAITIIVSRVSTIIITMILVTSVRRELCTLGSTSKFRNGEEASRHMA